MEGLGGVLEALGGVLEACVSVLEALGGVWNTVEGVFQSSCVWKATLALSMVRAVDLTEPVFMVSNKSMVLLSLVSLRLSRLALVTRTCAHVRIPKQPKRCFPRNPAKAC